MTPADGLIRIAATCIKCGWAIRRVRFRRVLVCEIVEEGEQAAPCWSCQIAIKRFKRIEDLRHTLPRLLFDLRR